MFDTVESGRRGRVAAALEGGTSHGKGARGDII